MSRVITESTKQNEANRVFRHIDQQAWSVKDLQVLKDKDHHSPVWVGGVVALWLVCLSLYREVQV